MYYRRYDFEITKREVLFSVIIFFVMLIIGVVSNSALTDHFIQKNDMYGKALKINAEESLFKQAMQTNFGNAFVYGDLSADTPVSYDDVKGEYTYIRQETERYTRHTRVVTYTTGSGKTRQTHTRTEVYWTWDNIGNDSKHTQSITFLGESFSYDRFDFSSHHIDTVSAGYHLRHVYYGVSSKMKGTIFTKLKDGTISENSKFNERALKDTVDSYMIDINTINIIFWIVWFIVTALIIFAFYYIDNRWLE